MRPYSLKATTPEEYIAHFTGPAHEKLVELRKIIIENYPHAEESISYAIIAYKYYGWFAYISGYTKHVSLSLPPRGAFQKYAEELSKYKYSKSTIQFPLDKPLPKTLIKKLLSFQAQVLKEMNHNKITKK